MSVSTELRRCLQAHISNEQQQYGRNPLAFFDPDSPSPAAIAGTEQQQQVQWQIHERSPSADLNELAAALEVPFPQQLSELFGSYYSGNLPASIDGHGVELLLPWNEDDFIRLQQNITGHVLMKRRLKQQDTVFIGLTEQDDLLLSVRLNDGAVCLEYVGKEPHHVLADDISSLLQQLDVL
ncbi:SecY-interacting protein [Pseudoalteromonas sp. MM17-2]|uniref:SecY-interacting protein n=1 Tax=Pseudoalteromonas sp. MM17-2 TaxID=2917753 RepID=UPI001EF55A8F|nr:SecY-interacting protein [Pseudoalteromonas sp. MM17-2]MCG7545168.1 SecY-interacting protein [Pseudoalteromonas sp. MM17-2]